jgi:NDP-sugar pyrophosphorylase family protein
MVLAAGLGTRMRPLSDLVAKPALPVLNRPLLHWTLERLARHGVRDVLVNTHHLPETIERALGRGRRFGLRVRYSHEPEILGSGGGPREVRSFFGSEPALLVNGDCWQDFDFTALLRRHLESGALATLALKPNPDPRHYGPVVCDPRGFVRSVRRLPRPARGRPWLFTGVQLIDPALLERLPRGASDIVPALYAPLLAEGGRILGAPARGRWLDLGTPGQYLAAQLALLRASPEVAREREADGSLRDALARVSRDALVPGTVLGRGSVVGPGARVRSSILWAGARVGPDARRTRCIVTTGARVAAGERLRGMIVLPAARVPIG